MIETIGGVLYLIFTLTLLGLLVHFGIERSWQAIKVTIRRPIDRLLYGKPTLPVADYVAIECMERDLGLSVGPVPGDVDDR